MKAFLLLSAIYKLLKHSDKSNPFFNEPIKMGCPYITQRVQGRKAGEEE